MTSHKSLTQIVSRILAGVIVFSLGGCHLSTCTSEDARERADRLMENIATGTANHMFSTKYFPQSQTDTIMKRLKVDCDFPSRKGGYETSYAGKDPSTGKPTINVVYKYLLACSPTEIRIKVVYECPSLEICEMRFDKVKN